MSTKTRIIVIRKNRLIAAAIILLAAILLLALLIHLSDAEASTADTAEAAGSDALYTPGIYTATVTLNDTAFDVQVTVDENHINSISMVNLDETVETMYPLIRPAMEELSEQIIHSQSLTDITYSESNPYTSMVLYEAICAATEKAVL